MVYQKIQTLRTKFNAATTRQLIQLLVSVNWKQNITNICRELNQTSQSEYGGKYVWMVGVNPTYFLQYQIDSYAIFKAYEKIILVWKPKYLEYPAIVPLTNFGQEPKIIKSMEVSLQERAGVFQQNFYTKMVQFLKNYYGKFYFPCQDQRFEKDLLTQLKHYASRISKDSYWHCALDNHNSIDASSRRKFIRIRIKGVRQKYDKDLILFSHQGVRQFLLKGKGFQIISFMTMLIIFITLIGCHSQSQLAVCSYKDEVMLGSAAIMMGLMGMRVATRNKFKKKLDKKIATLEKQN